MPRGKFVNHKGRSRHFSSPEELQQDLKEEEDSDHSNSGNEEKPQNASTSKPREKPKYKNSESNDNNDEEDDEDDDDDEQVEARGGKKGVAALIDIENPNRVTRKAKQNLTRIKMEAGPKPELSRREREQIEHQKAQQRYEKLHAAGKTTEAKADLARLAVIRRQRDEAAAKREAAKKANEATKEANK